MGFGSIKNTQGVDPVLSKLAVEYANNPQDYLADAIAPFMQVEEERYSYQVWDTTNAFGAADDDYSRGKSSPAQRASADVSTSSGKCVEHSLEFGISSRDKRAAQKLALGLEKRAQKYLVHRLMIEKEIAVRDLFFDTSTWTDITLSGTDQWSDSANSDPFDDIRTALNTVKTATGVRANTAIMGKEVFDKLSVHPDVTRAASLAGSTNLAMIDQGALEAVMAKLFRLERLYVGESIKNTGNAGDTFSGDFIWDKHCWLGFLTPAGQAVSDEDMAAVKTIGTQNWQSRIYEEKQTKQDVLETSSIYDAKVTAAPLGYLIIDAVA